MMLLMCMAKKYCTPWGYIFHILTVAVPPEVENFSQCLAKASSLSYAAGTADFDSINNFEKSSSASTSRNEGSNLEQSRRAIQEAKVSLDRIIALLTVNEQT